ncbi:hypothetical protein [Methylotuvimicrobium alcaliphilum]|uniref:Uncharacterized protein n=1 Tax=Methylotuvimicrobium alcaliphilum (strain DSM 19304 / NCIMB 14124 / VKM B-2133 / 20Z) TaxID=1091494 RepID=G4SZ33_META2|nr:hypothetical protein [Methylotuvimicrobium alcaliphilum]CCE25493.1 protein of unknown function [Methylotuvimicrobium alcaliphilum 20Z]
MTKLPDVSMLSLHEKIQLFDLLKNELQEYLNESETALSFYNLKVTYENVLCLALDKHEALEILEENIQSLCKDFQVNEVTLIDLVNSRYNVIADYKRVAEEIKDDLKALWELNADDLRDKEKLLTYFDLIKSAHVKKLLQQHIDQF